MGYKGRRARAEDSHRESVRAPGESVLGGNDEPPDAADVFGHAPDLSGPELIVFACSDGTGAAHLAAAWFTQLANPVKARAVLAMAGAVAPISPDVVTVMREIGIDPKQQRPRGLTPELLAAADLVVTLGDSFDRRGLEARPLRREHWVIPNFRDGGGLEHARNLAEVTRSRVAMLAYMEGWGRADVPRETTRIRRPRWSDGIAASS